MSEVSLYSALTHPHACASARERESARASERETKRDVGLQGLDPLACTRLSERERVCVRERERERERETQRDQERCRVRPEAS